VNTAIAKSEELDIVESKGMVQLAQLKGMSDLLSLGIQNAGFQVSKCLPFGTVENVIPYLMRRAEQQEIMLGEKIRGACKMYLSTRVPTRGDRLEMTYIGSEEDEDDTSKSDEEDEEDDSSESDKEDEDNSSEDEDNTSEEDEDNTSEKEEDDYHDEEDENDTPDMMKKMRMIPLKMIVISLKMMIIMVITPPMMMVTLKMIIPPKMINILPSNLQFLFTILMNTLVNIKRKLMLSLKDFMLRLSLKDFDDTPSLCYALL